MHDGPICGTILRMMPKPTTYRAGAWICLGVASTVLACAVFWTVSTLVALTGLISAVLGLVLAERAL